MPTPANALFALVCGLEEVGTLGMDHGIGRSQLLLAYGTGLHSLMLSTGKTLRSKYLN